MNDLFEFTPKIEMYITPNGRIVTPHALPWKAVEMIRGNNDGLIIDKNTITAEPPPRAPAAKRVQSRDSMGHHYPPNIPRMPSPNRTTITKGGRVLRTGYTNKLERMTYGTPQRQHIQLQMLKGLWKTVTCQFDATGTCRSGDRCCFRHRVDTDDSIYLERVTPIRQGIPEAIRGGIRPPPRNIT